MSCLPCPVCAGKVSIRDTRLRGANIRRRYLCERGHRFGTIEIIAPEGMKTEPALEAFARELSKKRIAEIGKKLHAAIATLTGELK